MKIRFKLVKVCSMFSLLVLGISTQALGQSISMDSDFITWKIAEVRNTITGEKTTTGDMFKSSPDSLIWVRDNGKAIYKLHIDSKFETWPDILADGSESFNVIWKNTQGRIAFRRDHGEAKILRSL